VLLCRSGRTAWELKGRVQGSSDIPLAPAGRDDIRQALAEVDASKLISVWTAPDEASLETAKLIASDSRCKIKPSEDLREVNLGLWEGSLREDLTGRYAKSYRLWREDPSAVTPAEGEPLVDAQARLARALEKIADKGAKSPKALVLRPVLLGLLKCLLTGEPTTRLWELMESQPQCEFITIRPQDLSKLREEASVS
jgi:broad specificity phosphatase PhoE